MTLSTALLAAAAIAVSIGGRPAGQTRTPAPPVPQATYQPQRPYEPQPDGVLARREYRTDAPGPFRAEITDLIVPPGKTATLAHEGVVVVEVRDGDGSATVQTTTTRLSTGHTMGLSQSQRARVENTGKTPLLLRVYVVTTQ